MNRLPIGLFDSGVGGLTVLRALARQLPHESTVYFGDTARVPYGSKSREVITRYSLEIAAFLMKQKIKLMVVACNTASAFSLGELRRRLPIPVIGVIEPGAEAALKASPRRRIGIIGTEGTIESHAYSQAIHARDASASVFGQACPLIVPLIEEGWTQKPLAAQVVKEYLRPLLKKRIETLVLGCTHYPLLKPVIRRLAGPKIQLIDSAEQTARTVKERLLSEGLQNPARGEPRREYFVSDAPQKFERIGSRFLGKPVKRVKWVDIREWK